MYFKNKKFLMGVAFTILTLIGLLAFDRIFLAGKFSTNNEKINRLKKDLEYTTQEALSLEQKNARLQKKVRILKPLARRMLAKEQKLLETEQAYSQAQLKILSLNEKINTLKDQFQLQLAELHHHYPQLISYYKGRYSFNTSLLFDNASADLNEEGEEFLMQFAEFLKEFIQTASLEFDWFIRIDGHTNHLPIHTKKFPSNWHLASTRALAVTEFLENQGVPGHYMVASSFGPFKPIVPIESPEALEKNRRIEFSISHY
jgi:chemotaxis protein MotB